MEVLRPFWYLTLWISKRHTIPLHRVIQVYNDKFDYVDGVMRALAKKKTKLKKNLYFTMQVACQKLSKYYAEVTLMTVLHPITVHILDPLRKWRSFRMWDIAIDMIPEEETSHTTQYREAFLYYMENEY